MAESSREPSSPDFGTNQWLVEEMYDRYQEDPTSVDASWVTFFEDGNVPSDNGSPSGTASTTTPTQPEKQPEPAPEKPEPAAKAEPTPEPAPKQAKPEPAPKQAEPEPKKDTAAPAAKSEPVKPDSDSAKKAADAEPPQPEKKAGDPGVVEKVTLRGAAARTVQNMDTSLTVPTATSVRAVPVKLLFDNRTVINNHLGAREAARSPSPTSSAMRSSRP